MTRSLLVLSIIALGVFTGECKDADVLVPSICAQDDTGCSAVRVEPTSDPNYVDCISNPSKKADECLVRVAKSEADASVDPLVACPTDAVLKSGLSTVDIGVKVRHSQPSLCVGPSQGNCV